MPLRFSAFLCHPLRLPLYQRAFHSSALLHNHYETLQISPSATPKEVKESFYALSKTHHPDRNPDDPTASDRFIKINDAYATLGTPAKKAAYDRDVMRSSSSQAAPRYGSYSSTGPAGGRPASGLSKRRTQFRGPPTSFYRSGGWGDHGSKRAAAQENGAPAAEKPSYDFEADGIGAGGMGHGQQPWGHGNNVPHFNKEAHFETHENMEQRRRQRRGATEDGKAIREMGKDMGHLGQFVLLTLLVTVVVAVPGAVYERIRDRPRNKT